ncbi:universal stress protein [Pseudomonas ogarae]|uniref:Universal stress protein n=1 Tax=Pseudomonas kilonensis TaxID=132476 RepID=A0A0F4XU69_9PSED|nr:MULTISPECIES: universal stress protein [Pseudomonas]KKA09469.1 universal stress protein [Pseudomonas ogarae]OPG74509.1 universal stress protein [Pseudomonas ogarae]PBJ09200.1 Universal stress protein E [Pseudomonas ogarae]QXH97441.1 universal stress protein [Pseudomonas zarinae]
MSTQSRLMLVVSPLMEHSPAFDRAAALAKAEGAALHIVAFDYLEGLATAGLVNEQALEQMRLGYIERHRQWLEEQARPLRKLGIEVTTEVTWVERPLQEILVHLKEAPMDALIKSVDPESWFSRLMFTPLDVHLLRECEVPLHFVNKVTHARPRKILAAIDPFHQDGRYEGLNDRILSEANKLASSCDATLEVIYAYDLSSITAAEYGFGNGSMFFSSTLARQLYESQGAAFDALAERNGIAPDQRRMIMGDPAKVLASYAASNDIDVIVMGRVRYGSLDKLIGSTVEGLLYKMPCSVWVIAPQQVG